MPVSLSKAAQDLRGRLGLSLRQAALELGVTHAHLCNVENGKASPSPEMLEKFHDAWGIDLYMYALVFFPEERETPDGLKAPVKALAKGWKRHIERLLRNRTMEGASSCLISAD